jgi:hypothetical protein
MTKNGTTVATKINILNKNYQQQTRSNKKIFRITTIKVKIQNSLSDKSKFIFRKMAQFDSPVKLCPSGPKKSRNGIQWEKWIICQSSYTELLISMRSRIKASLLISMTKNGTTADTKINILNKNYQQQTRSNKIDI